MHYEYREDGRDVAELLCHQQLYLDRRAGDRATHSSRRVRDQAVTLGRRRAPLATEPLNTFPVPHA
ncbi:hypothetical protein [Streptomyces canus]|uniref:hypothetical protein n=1 Tax=Streptomyces canus TaxID=58343 RepID=UPI003252EB7E